MEEHSHGPDGSVIISEPALAEPAVAEVVEVAEVADAEVEIARINAARDVKLAQTSVAAMGQEDADELNRLRGENAALRQTIEALSPPEPEPVPAPAPVIVEPEPETEPAPPIVEKQEPVAKKKPALSWF